VKDEAVVIGRSAARVDALSKVTGEALFPGDFDMPGQLWMKTLFAGRPHARIVEIDTREAEAYPGVVAVFTAKDVPVNEYGLILPDQPVLCGPGSAKEGANIVRCVSDQVALIVGESERAAAEARDLIKVTYEDLLAVFDPFEAMAEGAPQLHADADRNILCHYRIRKGDIEAGWAKADVIVEGTYGTTWQEHAYLQPEAGLGYIDDAGRVTVVVASQWAHEDREQIAHALALPEDQVRVIYPAIGGAFGGREDMSVQIVLALAAWKLKRPIKIIWSREESIIGHHKRHPTTIKTKWGATRGGKVVAAQVEVVGDAGAYAYTSTKVLGNTNLMCTGPYEIENVHVDTYAVYTNNLPSGAFRGFGGPQGAFAAENQINRLAEALGMDPVTIRLENALRDSSLASVGTPLPGGVTIPQVVEACARESFWEPADARWQLKGERPAVQLADPARRRGVGLACAFKNVGFSFGVPENCWATVELHGESEIEEVVVRHAGADVGQGAHTVIAQMAAGAVGVSLEKVRLVASDTAGTDDSGSASASRMTFMAGNAIRGAAEAALEAWRTGTRPAAGRFQYRAPKTTPYDPQTGQSTPNFAYGYVAQAVEVEVDVETGQVDLLRVVSANDVGRAINPQQVEGQIEGGVVQAQGYAIMENFQMRQGQVLTQHLSTYLIPTVMDIPAEIKSIVLECADPRGPWGARGMGEMPFLPLAPAIVAAVHDATGVWFDAIPLTPERVVTKLRAAGIGRE
jgi:CO/xanthine dehydrogenase Mo-binding subunit